MVQRQLFLLGAHGPIMTNMIDQSIGRALRNGLNGKPSPFIIHDEWKGSTIKWTSLNDSFLIEHPYISGVTYVQSSLRLGN
jgi:hypothetical protein